MSLIAALDLAEEIEARFSSCYSKICETFPELSAKSDLERLGQDEINHMNLIKTGKNYVFKAPGAFSEKSQIDTTLLKRGLTLIDLLLDDLDKTAVTREDALQRIYILEGQFEKVHLSTIADIKEPSLVRLFGALSMGDKAHRERLEKILVDLDIKLPVVEDIDQ